VLVLDAQHRVEAAVRQPQALRDEAREEGPELLVRGDHGLDARAGVPPRHALDEGERVEREEARVVREAEEVEPLEHELVAARVARVARGRAVPFVREEDKNASGHRPQLRRACPPRCCAPSSS
jgi:hypothetical protein